MIRIYLETNVTKFIFEEHQRSDLLQNLSLFSPLLKRDRGIKYLIDLLLIVQQMSDGEHISPYVSIWYISIYDTYDNIILMSLILINIIYHNIF